MNFKILTLFFILIAASESIFLTIKTNNARCLCQYTSGSVMSQSMKFKISFPQIDNVLEDEHFIISIKNTETDKMKTQIVKPGNKYVREEEQLIPNVIYEVCIVLKSSRSLELIFEYQSQNIYSSAQSQIAVPSSLLTKNDMKGAFLSATYVQKILAQYKQQQKLRDTDQNQSFLEVQKLNYKLTLLSGIQITVVIVISLYQFFALKNYLCSKQYI